MYQRILVPLEHSEYDAMLMVRGNPALAHSPSPS